MFWCLLAPWGSPGGPRGAIRASPELPRAPRERARQLSYLGRLPSPPFGPGGLARGWAREVPIELLECVELELGSAGLELAWAEDQSSGF